MELTSYFIETWGCQMNVLDGQRLAGELTALGMRGSRLPTTADVVLLNTCSVRERAVDKVRSRIGALQIQRQETGKPVLIGVCGCVGEQAGEALLGRFRGLDFVLGTGRVGHLAVMIDQALAGHRGASTGFDPRHDYEPDMIARGSSARQYVTAIHGCDQRCTFCIVPTTRGPEVSRRQTEVIDEVRSLAASGVQEVTLLGQTVNAYRCPESGASFADLLEATCAVEGLWQVSFMTSHPRYFTDELIATIGRAPRLSRYVHIPFQSGSDVVLRRMNRGTTRADYLDVVRRLRAAAPDLTLSTDVLVGFPGESDADFVQTLDLVEQVRFGQLFGFVYSPRPGTPAARLPGRLPPAVTSERLDMLFALQDRIQLDLNQRLVKHTVEVLVDGPAKHGEAIWQGRGHDNRVVNFPAWSGIQGGDLAWIEVTGATPHALLGTVAVPPSLTAARPGLTLDVDE